MIIHLGSQSVDIKYGGYVSFAERWTNAPHRHPEYQELCWVISGSGEFTHGTQHFPVHAGSCFLSEINIVHEISSAHTKDLELYYMSITPCANHGENDSEAKYIWKHYQHQHHLHCHISQTELYWQLIESASPQRADFLLRALFLESLSQLSVNNVESTNPQHTDPCHIAMSYIRNHCREAPSIAEIAANCTISERQLRRLFQQRYGCGLIEAVNTARLEEARHLLLMHNNVSATAHAIGIASPAMFSRLFKQAFGCSPNQWRKQHVHTDHVAPTIFDDDK